MVGVISAVLGGAVLLLSYFVAYQSTSWFVVAHAVLGNAVLLLAFFFLHRDVREARSVTRDSTLTYSDRSGDACPRVREPKTFTGCANFKENAPYTWGNFRACAITRYQKPQQLSWAGRGWRARRSTRAQWARDPLSAASAVANCG